MPACRLALLPTMIIGAGAIAAPTFTITEITDWSDTQLQMLPFFQRYVASIPGTAPSTGFAAYAQNQTSVVGSYADGQYGVIVQAAGFIPVPALGTFHWQRTWYDGKDVHFANGTVTICQLFDINPSGTAVGESTIEGSGEYASEYNSHAVMRVIDDPTLIDLTPDAHQASATAINNAGVITGWARTETGPASGFVRLADGAAYQITSPAGALYPTAINNSGRVAGHMAWPDNGGSDRAFVAEPYDTMPTALPLPSQNSPTESAAYDLSDDGIIVGATWRNIDNHEHVAALWERQGDGSWEGFELNELLEDNPVDALLENAIALSPQGHIIVKGRPDGTDVLGTALYLLTPMGVSNCAADLNSDGTLDFFDVSLFLSQMPDFNNDGGFDFFDVSAFLGAYSAGCP